MKTEQVGREWVPPTNVVRSPEEDAFKTDVCVGVHHRICSRRQLCTIRDVSDAPAGTTQKQGHTGRVRYHLPPFMAIVFLFLSRKVQPPMSLVVKLVTNMPAPAGKSAPPGGRTTTRLEANLPSNRVAWEAV